MLRNSNQPFDTQVIFGFRWEETKKAGAMKPLPFDDANIVRMLKLLLFAPHADSSKT